MAYPAGLLTWWAVIDTTALGSGAPVAGDVRVYASRRVAYGGKVIEPVSAPYQHRLVDSKVEIELPCSDATGLIGDNGAVIAPSLVSFEFEIRPTRSQTWRARTVTATMAQAAAAPGGTRRIPIANLADLGGWPHVVTQTVYVEVPGSGGGGLTGSWVETPAGSKEYKWVTP